MCKRNISGARIERGAVAVEFALVATVFFTVLTGIVAVAHWMYTLEMISDAARVAARLAAVCNLDAPQIKKAVQNRVPQLALKDGQIRIDYLPDGCIKTDCERIRVSFTDDVTYTALSPFIGNALSMPAFTTQLLRESMESTNTSGASNPVCA